MTQQITWNLQIESSARHATFNSKAIFAAFGRIGRYWDVQFPQVLRGTPWMRFVITNRMDSTRNPRIAAWTTGRSIYFPTAFRFASYDQCVAVIVHEIGHVLGGSSHAPPGNVMAASLSDVYMNFTQTDARWFRLPQKASPKPWNEPNHWRPAARTGFVFSPKLCIARYEYSDGGNQPADYGHGSWSDRWHQLTARHSIEKVEE